MRLDTRQALRSVACLPNPGCMQAAGRGRGFAAQAPRCLNPSAMQGAVGSEDAQRIEDRHSAGLIRHKFPARRANTGDWRMPLWHDDLPFRQSISLY